MYPFTTDSINSASRFDKALVVKCRPMSRNDNVRIQLSERLAQALRLTRRRRE